jgi:LemA protein
MSALIILLVIIAVVILWSISMFNRIIWLIEAVKNNKKQIDIQLDRRFKVFQSLIETVKKYMDYEQTTLKDVVALRNQAKAAEGKGDEGARMEAENKISTIASNLNVVFENYPDLKADKNALQLQEEIVNTENKLTYAKQAYNDSIENYNATKKSFPQSIIVGAFQSKLNQEFAYWGLADEATIKEREDYTVKF